MKTHDKFLEFNGKRIVYLSADGTYWIPLKPICEALNIDADRVIKNVKKDPILGAERSKQTVQVSNNDTIQGRNMTCLPEEFIYGWLFSIRSDSSELTEYKRTCYKLLFKHFHGTITNRKELLLERIAVSTELHNNNEELLVKVDLVKENQVLATRLKAINRTLRNIDNELVKEPELFN